MPRLLVVALFLVVSLDLSTPDAVLALADVRAVQSDDEEDSIPGRRQRVGEEERRVAAFPVPLRLVEQAQSRPSTERRASADRRNRQTVWQGPVRQAPVPSVRSGSPPEDQ